MCVMMEQYKRKGEEDNLVKEFQVNRLRKIIIFSDLQGDWLFEWCSKSEFESFSLLGWKSRRRDRN